jgi:hypothetical protein
MSKGLNKQIRRTTMAKRYYPTGLTILQIFFLVAGTMAYAENVYDVNGDGKEGLAESIHSLQVTAGLIPASVPNTSFTNSIGNGTRPVVK